MATDIKAYFVCGKKAFDKLDDNDRDKLRNNGIEFRSYKKLIECAHEKVTENPITDDKIDVDASIWPEIFWGKSHVALFQPSEVHQYNILKKYDWYCYLLDESINSEKVFSHIKEGEN